MDKEILEGNKLIAEFMGHGGGISDEWNNKPADYNASWMWLMPVVEKICSTIIKGHPPFNSDQFVRVEIVPNGYIKISNLIDTPIFKNVSVEGSLIKAVWLAVAEFIKWYNKNK